MSKETSWQIQSWNGRTWVKIDENPTEMSSRAMFEYKKKQLPDFPLRLVKVEVLEVYQPENK